jgi:hypothetical protein
MGDIFFPAQTETEAYQELTKEAAVKRGVDLKIRSLGRIQQKL